MRLDDLTKLAVTLTSICLFVAGPPFVWDTVTTPGRPEWDGFLMSVAVVAFYVIFALVALDEFINSLDD